MYTKLLTNCTLPLSYTVTNLGPRPFKYVTFSTYKLAIAKCNFKYVTFSTYKLAMAKYNLNFKLI